MTGSITLHAQLTGASTLQDRLRALNPTRELDSTLSDIGNDAQRGYALVAPKRTGALARGIKFQRLGTLSGEIDSTVRNDQGVNYTKWTRFGRGEILPKPGKELRFVIGGRVVFERRVPPWKPPGGDWADRAKPYVDGAVQRRMSALGDRLTRSIAGS